MKTGKKYAKTLMVGGLGSLQKFFHSMITSLFKKQHIVKYKFHLPKYIGTEVTNSTITVDHCTGLVNCNKHGPTTEEPQMRS